MVRIPEPTIDFAIPVRAMRAMDRVFGVIYPEEEMHGIGYEPELTQEYNWESSTQER